MSLLESLADKYETYSRWAKEISELTERVKSWPQELLEISGDIDVCGCSPSIHIRGEGLPFILLERYGLKLGARAATDWGSITRSGSIVVNGETINLYMEGLPPTEDEILEEVVLPLCQQRKTFILRQVEEVLQD